MLEDDEELQVGEDEWQWNERFQRCVCMPESTPQEKLAKYSVLTSLNKDFITTATTYARTIINEYFLPDDRKSVRVGQLGGVAGGVKFVWSGILFKLADGSQGPYKHHHTPDEAAAKAIGHDLKGAEQYYRCSIPNLHFALQAIIDYKGFRMHTQAVLPISRQTLKVGSDDACQSVKADDSGLLEKLKLAGKELNLAQHTVGGVELYSACDVEGHLGEDGRHYLVDFARTFPPESPRQSVHLQQPTSYRVGQRVLACLAEGSPMMEAYVSRVFGDSTYEVLLLSGQSTTTATRTQLKHLDNSVFWRLLRPEFVKNRGQTILRQRRMMKKHHSNSVTSAPTTADDTLSATSPTVAPSHFEASYLPADTLLGWTRQFSTTETAEEPPMPYAPMLTREHSYEAFISETSSEFGINDEDVMVPLSPDALTAFSRDDPNRDALNMDIDKATSCLMHQVIPALAEELADKGHPRSTGFTMVEFLHMHGVNVRHCGLLRYYLPPSNEALAHIRAALLLEIVSRTIKNLVRDALRSWMKQKRSTSEMAIRQLLSKYLCLTTGQHPQAKQFWDLRVLPGIMVRFGACSLTALEQQDLQASCRADDQLLRNIILTLCRMLGIVLTEQVRQQFSAQPACKFEFVTSDIELIIPVVKHMHQVDLAEGIMLCQLAHQRNPHGELSFAPRVVELAVHHLKTAMKAVPDDMATRHSLGDAYQMLGWLHADSQIGAAYYEQARQLWNDDPNTHCSTLRLSFHDDIIGVLVHISYPKHLTGKHKMAKHNPASAGEIPPLKIVVGDVDFEPISLRAHLEKYQQRERFFPLIINEEHGLRAFPLLQAQIQSIASVGKFPLLVELSHPSIGIGGHVELIRGEPTCPVEQAAEQSAEQAAERSAEQAAGDTLNVMASIMNQLVVSFVKRIVDDPTDLTEEALLGYMRFHHTLLFLASKNPCIAEVANRHIERFIEDPNYRTKDCTPDLGNFLVYLLLSPRPWSDLSKIFLFELVDRGVFWFIEPEQPGARPELLKMETSVVDPYRLATTFSCSKTSIRLVMFQVYFTNSIGRRAGYSWDRMLEMYNSSYGRPTAGMRDNMREQVHQILAIQRYDDFLFRIGVRFTPAEFTKVLRNAIRSAIRKGYVRCLPKNGPLVAQLGEFEDVYAPIDSDAARTTWDQVWEEYEANSSQLIEAAQAVREELRKALTAPKMRKLARSSTGHSNDGENRGGRKHQRPDFQHSKSLDDRAVRTTGKHGRESNHRKTQSNRDERVWRKGEEPEARSDNGSDTRPNKGRPGDGAQKRKQRHQHASREQQSEDAKPSAPTPVAIVTSGKSYSSVAKAQAAKAPALRATAPEFVPKPS